MYDIEEMTLGNDIEGKTQLFDVLKEDLKIPDRFWIRHLPYVVLWRFIDEWNCSEIYFLSESTKAEPMCLVGAFNINVIGSIQVEHEFTFLFEMYVLF